MLQRIKIGGDLTAALAQSVVFTHFAMQNPADQRHAKSQLPPLLNLSQCDQLFRRIPAVSSLLVDLLRPQQTDRIIIPQCFDRRLSHF